MSNTFLEFPIQIQRQFNAPLDVDSKVETLTDLEALESNARTYEGMLTYCVEDSTLYIYNKDGKFEPLSNKQDTTSDDLETTDKTIVGAINEVKDSIITNYEDLTNKPSIAGVELDGNKSLSDLGITMYDDTEVKGDIGNLNTYKQNKTDDTLTTTDKTITGAINEINGNLLDTVEFSADYKNIILNRKNGLNPYTIPISSIINNTSLAELKDVDSTDIGNGKILVYDGATNKHKYVDSSTTDELVKMDSTTDAKYLSDLIDKSTVINDNGVLKVKKLDGQEVTITEINYLKGLTMNIMDLVNVFASGGVKVWETPVDTYADLATLDRSTFIDGISYIVYVLVDETHADAKTTYLCDKTSSTFFGNADSQRNFVTNPIDLANEVTGKLGTSNIDVDSLWNLLTINSTYKTLTTNNEVFGTHGAKALYDELVTAIGTKANSDDLTTHTSNTDIHTSATEKASYVKKSDITTTINSTSADTQVASAKAVYNVTSKILKTYTSIEQLGLTNGSETIEDIVNSMENSTRLIAVIMDTSNTSIYPYNFGTLIVEKVNIYRTHLKFCKDMLAEVYVGAYHGGSGFTGWKKLCTTSVADVPRTAITWSDETNYKSSYTGCYYMVKNGICYVTLDIDVISVSSKGVKLKNNSLPKSSFDYIHRSIPPHRTVGSALTLAVVNGVITLSNGTNGCRYLGSFSYPAAES